MHTNETESRRIMIVEDEKIVALEIQQSLKSLGYSIAALADSGEDAIRLALELQPNLILMDINLKSELSGVDAAIQIRRSTSIPIIFLTAFSDDEIIEKAKVVGASGFLIKPFEDRELHSNIEIAMYKHSMEAKLCESEERYALVIRALEEGIWDWDISKDSVFYSARWFEMLGIDKQDTISCLDEWLGRVHPEDQPTVKSILANHERDSGQSFQFEYRIRHEDGDYHWMSCRGLSLLDRNGSVYRIAGSQSDITEKRKIEQALVYKALNDELTGLPNRALFMDRLTKSLIHGRREPKKLSAVFFLDIDHFKYVNDCYGHAAGDELLVGMAKRLASCMREGDTVARFGGDEFVILADDIQGEDSAILIAERILQDFKQPFSINHRDAYINASIGIAIAETGSSSPESLIQEADTAMYFAKNMGRACYQVFGQKMQEYMVHRLDTERELRAALVNREFILHYQPIWRIKSRTPVGFEALIRWNNPVRGMVPPDDFIPVAEQTKLILPIGAWVLRTACVQAKKWNVGRSVPISISVNVSRIQLYDPLFPCMVRDVLSETGLDASLLELEVTESAVMTEIVQIRAVLEELMEMGVRLGIDDFGSGYSSFGHLNRFPASTLKIDKSFIDVINADEHSIVSAIIVMGHKLNLKVISEGVENAGQLLILDKLGCDEVQGFFLGKGIPADEVDAMLRVPVRPARRQTVIS